MKSVLAFGPDAVILGADPPQLDCCDLVSEIKGSEQTQNIRVVMLAPGGSGERTRGMDLGADDILSIPFDPHDCWRAFGCNYGQDTSRMSFESGCVLPREIEALPSR